MDVPRVPVATAPTLPRSRANWKRRSALLAIAVIVGSIWYGDILAAIASGLIVDERHTTEKALLILGGDQRFEVASRMVSDGAETVLIFRSSPGRLERMGILPSAEKLTRRELLKQRVPHHAISLLCEEPIDYSQIPNQLCDWLQQNPGHDIGVLCDRFSSGNCSRSFGRAVNPEFRKRLHIIALPHRDYDESNWWQTKQGTLAVFNGYLSLAFECCHDQGRRPAWKERTPADFDMAVSGRRSP